MSTAVLSERCDRALTLAGQTQAYQVAVSEIRDAVASSSDPATRKALIALAERLVEKTGIAAAEASALAAISTAETSARRAAS